MTTSALFLSLLSRIAPLQSEIDAAECHIATIRTRLADGFNLKSFVRAGSYSRGTFIRGGSDVDLFAVVARDDLRWGGRYVTSDTALDNFGRELKARFPSTAISRDVHAIVLEFNDCHVDVVPAFFSGMTASNHPLYAIPDGGGGWMNTSPARHNAFIRQKDEASRGKLRRVAQLIKFWRECRSPRVALSSFHIEMVLASEDLCLGVKSYGDCVTEVLQGLAQRECRGLQDPLRISGLLPAVKTEARRDPAVASVRYSRDHAKVALRAVAFDDHEKACRQWDIVFNGYFPKS
jgi:hypothetical protein